MNDESNKSSVSAGALSTPSETLAKGAEPFTIASRIIREFGERLVKQPEVALLELVKNSYDADASLCSIEHSFPEKIVVKDDGHGMTLDEFLTGWMRIGTSSKIANAESRRYERKLSGEKGIGRFAVSYLGRALELVTIAYDVEYGFLTELTASFDWPSFDRHSDLGTVTVPYELRRAPDGASPGTQLTATVLRSNTSRIDFRQVQTASLGLLSPYQTLLRKIDDDEQSDLPAAPGQADGKDDPGFNLVISGESQDHERDISADILKNFVFRSVVSVHEGRLKLRLYRRGEKKAFLAVDDQYSGDQGRVYADLRFFPARKGTFAGMPVDGREARTWIKRHAGVAVFDRNFRVLPYGTDGDDWLSLSADNVRNERNPSSSIARRHFPMDAETRLSTQLNYMLRLPYPHQLVGAVQVFGVRTNEQNTDAGLVATADRQGFVDNSSFKNLVDIVRGAAEVIAYADRELQLEDLRRETEELAESAERQTQEAIDQIRANPNLTISDKNSLIKRLTIAQQSTSRYEDVSKTREAALEVMSLLGVVAGFMTHEFGTALDELAKTHTILLKYAEQNEEIKKDAVAIAKHIQVLKDFVAYSQGYIKGASIVPEEAIPARPRIRQIVRVFGKYASDRNIQVKIDVDRSVMAPQVPISLYGGIVLNLYTNALKAVTAKQGGGDNIIAIRAWSDARFHRLQVSDTGVGIPSSLEERVFDPLFSTTESSKDPMGSGMGLGLTLVRRGARAFGGSVNLVKPPAGFITCFEVKFPVRESE